MPRVGRKVTDFRRSRMKPRATLSFFPPLLLLLILAALVGCGAIGKPTSVTTPTPTPTPNLSAVKHIIFLAEENRSFDHYFGKLNDYRSAAPFNLPREINGLPADRKSTNSARTAQSGA